ncbi:type I restriction-modification system subunit M [Facklamia sp. 7083-14-GEN3]|uniref:type I restriction-modification system subunit M n=1 Tax=Facklamia sp. 7083-14-GEN3 TaxID=2973478 RepID=UPI00215C267D|nr:type I restriction-modification system subunit M [Facklamia sp. 7083-14-GEN3]MCR8969088.1 type I restriction-modification system subunit M [Facklamia sp. 7083-14-GEN3]
MITSEEIKSRLWDGANELRGSMDASRYKDYMLGLMFYKFLSDKTLNTFKESSQMGNDISERELVEAYKEAHDAYEDALNNTIQSLLGYYVEPEYLYQSWLIDINDGEFEVQKVTDSLHYFERSIVIEEGADDFKGLFSSSTIDLTDTALGSNLNERSRNIQALIMLFADLNMVSLQEGDILGDAYEYLIGQFAMESGAKAGEFYTPKQVSEIMARIVAKSSDIRSIYDPTVGSGSLLLTVAKHLDAHQQRNLSYYGQEKNTATYNLTRMNLLLHGVRPEKMTIKNGDTLAEDWPEDPERPNEGVQFDAVVMNPPYSVKGWNRFDLTVSDPRFEVAGILPPPSRGDFSFLLHGLFHLGQEGTMAIVLPHGVLFRGGAEGEIRQRLLEKNYIDTVIGLPSSLFTNTGIPVTVIILKKNRALDESVLMIDASEHFIKVGKQNVLEEKDIAKIVDTYVSREEIEGYSYNVSRREIIENEYNLNIPRYVVHPDDEIPHDVDAHLYGGIPKQNIDNLPVLNEVAPNILSNALEEIRPNYFKLKQDMGELTENVLNSEEMKAKANEMTERIKDYINHYWPILKKVDDTADVRPLMEEMLVEIKELLSNFKHLNIYDGYQIVAELWENHLTEDVEKISTKDFYELGRLREPNMVTKGSGKNQREEQKGWVGTLVPIDLIRKELYAEEEALIEEVEAEMIEIESALDELVEAAQVEDSDENEVLGETLNASKTSFLIGNIRSVIKNHEKGTDDYELVQRVLDLLTMQTKINRSRRDKAQALDDKVQDRILELTNEEIDQLVYKKWFGDLTEDMIRLIEEPLKEELDTLKELANRYKDTLDVLEAEYKELEASFKDMASQLVVTEDD